MFALKEAITSAHQEGDNACLQHCLSWLYKMEPYSNIGNMMRKNFLVKNACSRAISNELYVILKIWLFLEFEYFYIFLKGAGFL